MPRHVIAAILLSTTFMFFQTLPCSADCTSYSHSVIRADWPGGLIIDHNCIDLSAIPAEWIDSAKNSVKVHYAHTSHGEQITTGLELIETDNSTFSQAQGDCYLPTDSDVLCILDGNPPYSYITPDLYWQTPEGIATTEATLTNNPSLTVSMWMWCTQLDSYSQEETQAYLDEMSSLELAHPGVTFVYMTGNAQATGSDGYNRWLRNEQIRQFCRDGSKILFDFEDLDCWSGGTHSTYEYSTGGHTYTIPCEHPDFHGDEAAHTTYSSCEQKGRAFWWLVACIAGWNAPQTNDTTTSGTTGETSDLSFTNEILLGVGLLAALVLIAVIVYRRRP
jgi:hypothetical protein